MRTQLAALTAAMIFCTVSGQAHAQSNKAAAEQLFRDGRTLMKAGDYAQACPKLQASLELDPALGTKLNLAICFERIGKLASAWAHYTELAELARRDGDTTRENYARKQALALEPRLARLAVDVPRASEMAGLQVERDGVLLVEAVFGTPVPVDAGEHVITAKAPGFEAFSTTLTIQDGEQRRIEVPVMEKLPESDPTTSRPIAPAGGGETRDGPAPTPGTPGKQRRLVGLAVGGVGVVALATGIGFGVSSYSKWNGAFDSGACDSETLLCTPEGQAQTDTSRTHARLSDVLVGAGVVLAATGAVLYLTAPKARPPEGLTARVLPVTSADHIGVAIIGAF